MSDDDDAEQYHFLSFQFSWAASAVLSWDLGFYTKRVSNHQISEPPDPEEDARESSSSMI